MHDEFDDFHSHRDKVDLHRDDQEYKEEDDVDESVFDIQRGKGKKQRQTVQQDDDDDDDAEPDKDPVCTYRLFITPH